MMHASAFPMRTASLLVLLAALAGCAGSGAGRADRLLASREYAAAVTAYEAAEAERPDDPTIRRNHGVALLRSGNAAAAVTKLEQAVYLDALDTKARLFLARAHDVQGETEAALRAYGAYVELGGRFTPEVRARMESLTRERGLRDIRRALAREDSMMTVLPPDNTLAVPPFVSVVASETMDALANGLAALMITDLTKVRRFRIMERGRLQVILQELQLAGASSTAGAADTAAVAAAVPPAPAALDPATAPRVGRLMGVHRFVQGFVVPLGETGVQLSASLVEVTTGGEASAGEPLNGELTGVLRLAKDLVYQVLASLGVEPTDEERREIDRFATESVEALLAFGRGISLEKRGRFGEAVSAFREARTLDPGFVEAAAAEDYLTRTDEDLARAVDEELEEVEEEAGMAGIPSVLRDVAYGIGRGPLPDEPGNSGGSGGSGVPADDTGDAYDITPIDPDKVPRTLPDFPPPPSSTGRGGAKP